ncbi:MAG: LysR family transcriptional regulator [Kistimonas sp.]|nr:LysR family transcriptional regulator [Kistimonas sp.]
MSLELLRRFDLNLVVVLHVLLEERSVSRSAARLCLSQSAVSRALARLRSVFADELFVRLPHGLQPTARALALASELTDVLGALAQLVAPPLFDPVSCRQAFCVSMMEHLSVQIMPSLLARLEQEAPGVRIQVEPWSRCSLHDMTVGHLDLCINIVPLQRHDLHCHLIAPAPGFAFVARNHPYAGCRQISLSQYKACSHVRLDSGEYTALPFPPSVASLLAERTLLLSTSDPHLACEVVSQTRSLMVGTRPLCRWWMERYRLQALRLPAELSALDSHYQMTWHQLTHRTPEHVWLRRVFLEACQSLLETEQREACVA